ncbi:UNVERIFIED_CONTAM: hypothetical protein FKN15_025548 [Acipenser sinensis]
MLDSLWQSLRWSFPRSCTLFSWFTQIDLSLPHVTRLNVTDISLTAFHSQGGQPHKRRRTSEPTEIEDRLESLICRVGEKSTSSLESNLEGLAGVLEADLPNYKNKILRILCTVARLLPEKLTVYSTLVGLLNARNYNFGGEFVESMIRQLKETLKSNLYDEALYLVRFLSDLVNCHVIAAPSMVAMFENFISVVQEQDGPQVRCDWYVYAVLSSLPWVGKELYEKKDVEMERLLNQIESYLKRRQKIHVPMLQVWTAEKPHPQEEVIIATAPPHSEDAVYPMPKVIFRMFDYTDAPEGPVMPGSHSVERFVIEENLHCIIKSHWRERKTCAAQLLSYPGKNKIPLNYHIVETLLHMAAKSFSHSFSALAKFHEVLKSLTDSDEGKLHILRVVYEAWRNHPQMISVLIDKMIRTQIVDCAAVANWIFSPDMAHDFTRFYVWEILHSTVRKMNKHVQKIQKELETAKEKLEKQHSRKKDSGDEEEDKNSDEEDGLLEEQIERLQEKVESAQSEQKNLFLVIFQRFIMMLTEHLVRCETGGVDFNTPWYKNCIERLQQIFLMHHQTIQQYMVTLENLLFTAELDHHILAVYQQFCTLQM